MKNSLCKAMIPMLLTGLMIISSIFFSPSQAKGEAASDLLGRYSCSKVKELLESAPEEIFKMWANSGQFGSNSAQATEIIMRGELQGVLSHIGDINTLIQGLEELASGDPKNVAKIFADWALGKALTTLGTGVPGAVWTVCKELNTFAIALNAEIVDLNVKMFANFAEIDPKILSSGGEEYFLKTWLDSDSKVLETYGQNKTKAERLALLWDRTQRRAALLEYAKVKLGQKDFPPPSEWKNNRNLVRSVTRSMLDEVSSVIKKRKKIRQLQGVLKTQLNNLKKEQKVLTTFQALRDQVLVMTCQDPSPDCLSAYTSTLQTIEGLIMDAGDIKSAGSGTINGLKTTINALNSNLDDIFKKMNQSQLKIEKYCTRGKDEWQSVNKAVDQAKAATANAAAQAVRAGGYMKKACAATTLADAGKAASMAQDAAAAATQVANSLSFLGNTLEKHAPPLPIDFSEVATGLSNIDSRLTALEESIQKNFKKKEKAMGGVAKAKNQAIALEKECKGAKDTGLIDQTIAKLERVVSQIPDIRADINTLASLQSKTGLIHKRLAGLKQKENKNRECLKNIPDMRDLVHLVQNLFRKANADRDNAIQHANAAAACYTNLKNKCGSKERLDGQGNCICIDGYEKINGECKKKCRANEERAANGNCVPKEPRCTGDSDCQVGYVCNKRTGKCVSPFDSNYSDYNDAMAQRDDDRSQNVADQTAADQGTQKGNNFTSDGLGKDLDDMQSDISKKCKNNSQCPDDFVCQNGECVQKIGCTSASDCRAGQECQNGSCVDITPANKPATLTVSPANKAVVLNETVNFTAIYTSPDGTSQNVTGKAQWSPSSSLSKGAIGVYAVTANYQGLTATAQITVVQEKGMDDITVSKKIITVTFWDHGKEDGDMIDILINGKVAFPGITLKTAHQSRTITMNASVIVVGFKALNVGSIAPNTATVTFSSVTAGKETQQYTLTKDQEANMNVNYKP